MVAKFNLTDMLNSNSKESASSAFDKITGAGNNVNLAEEQIIKNEVLPSSLDQLALEIKFYSQQTALNMIEVGKRLILAKKEVGYGNWGGWLERVDYSQERARQFMRVAEEFGDSNTCWNLTPSKVIALLDLPSGNRESFLSQPHELPSGEIKTVDEMTTRQLQQAIKAQKEAESRAEEAEQRENDMARMLKNANDLTYETENKVVDANNRAESAEGKLIMNSNFHLRERQQFEEKLSDVANIEEENAMLREENKKLANRPTEVAVQEIIKEVVPSDYDYLKQQNELLTNEVATLTQVSDNAAPSQITIAAAKKIKKILENKLSIGEINRQEELKYRATEKTEITEYIRILNLLMKTVDEELFEVVGDA